MERVPESTISPLEFRKHIILLEKFTRTYRENQGEETATREARCLEVQYPDILAEIEEGDLLAGKIRMPAICFTPQAGGNEGGFAYVCNMEAIRQLMEDPGASSADKSLLKELMEFWAIQRTSAQTRKAYPESLQKGLPSDRWLDEPGIAFPLYRMAGTHLDYRKLIDNGIPGLSALILERINVPGTTDQQKAFYHACIEVLNLLIKICRHYALQATELALVCREEHRGDMRRLSEVLQALTIRKPVHFFEGAQLAFLYCLVSVPMLRKNRAPSGSASASGGESVHHFGLPAPRSRLPRLPAVTASLRPRT